MKYHGRCLVDIDQFFKSIKKIFNCPFGCTFKDLEFIKELQNGFFSTLFFKCKICNLIEKVTNECQNTLSMPINTAVVNTGQGFSQLDTTAAFLSTPSILNQTYQKIHNNVLMHTEVFAMEAMLEVGKEESEIAIKKNNVYKNGVPFITVISDGAWSKWSYKSGYNALFSVVCKLGLCIFLKIIITRDYNFRRFLYIKKTNL